MGENHPIEQEELMAYLDGELSTDRAATAVAHLERCSECQRLAADLRDVSQTLMAWEVTLSSPRIEQAITSALEGRGREGAGSKPTSGQLWRNILRLHRFAPWALGFAAICLVAFASFRRMTGGPIRMAQVTEQTAVERLGTAGKLPQKGATYDRLEQFAKLQAPPAAPIAADSNGLFHGLGEHAENSFSVDGQPVPGRGSALHREGFTAADSIAPSPNGPMIVRTAAVTLTTKDFDKARAGLDNILKWHHGYVGELNVNTPVGMGHTINAALRVPADQLEATLADLRKLGRVEAESQSGQEVTAQYVDLEARLANARNTERRLTDLLQQRTGKLSDVLAVETELSRVRGQIEGMESERKNLANQVDFATLNVTVNEDYKAQLQVVPPSTSTQFRNAAVDGYRTMVDGIVGVGVFLVSYAPSLLFWAALLFFPVRSLLRKVRPSHR